MSWVLNKSTSGYRTGWRWGLAALVWSVVTMAWFQGHEQLQQIDAKRVLHADMTARLQEPELDTLTLLAEPAGWSGLHRRVALEGFWLLQHTVLVADTNAQGEPGFWVMTPLQMDAYSAVLVQRGWIARLAGQPDQAPAFETDSGVVRLQGRIAHPVIPLAPQAVASAPLSSRFSKIRQNLDLAQFREETGVHMQALVLQMDPSDEGLTRQVSLPPVSVDSHRLTALSWFALAALLAGLSIWFHVIRPLLNARPSSP